MGAQEERERKAKVTRYGRIRAAALEAQARGEENSFLTLTLPGAQGDRTFARLFGRRGPTGQILSENVGDTPSVQVQFQADDVIRAIDAELEQLNS
jgi:hypothetical protein